MTFVSPPPHRGATWHSRSLMFTAPVMAANRRGWAPWLLGGGAAALITATGLAVVGVGLLGALLWWSQSDSDPAYDPKPVSAVPAPAAPAPVVVPARTVPAEAPAPTEGKVMSEAFDVQIHEWHTQASTSNGVFNFTPEESGYVLWLAQATVTRNDTTHEVDTFPWSLVDAAGQSFDAPLQCSMSISDGISPMHTYELGQTLEGTVCFVAPADLREPEIHFTPLWGSDVALRFPLR